MVVRVSNGLSITLKHLSVHIWRMLTFSILPCFLLLIIIKLQFAYNSSLSITSNYPERNSTDNSL